MPSLNARRQVRYTAADLNAIDGALAVLQFVEEFDREVETYETINGLTKLKAVIDARRKKPTEKQPTKPA